MVYKDLVQWRKTEIAHGRFSMECDRYRLKVFADFSGLIIDNLNGNVLSFSDLRVLLNASKILEEALVEHYGG